MEQLQHIIDPSEATQILQIPLELVCLSSSTLAPSSCGMSQSWNGTSSAPPAVSLPPDLLYSLQVFVDLLFQNINEYIAREHECGLHPPASLKPSIREWIRNQQPGPTSQPVESASARSSQNSKAQSTPYGLQTFDSRNIVKTPIKALSIRSKRAKIAIPRRWETSKPA